MLIHWIHSLTVGNLIINSFSIAEMLFSPFHIHVNFINFNAVFLLSHKRVEDKTEKEHRADVPPTEPSIASHNLGYEPEECTLGIG